MSKAELVSAIAHILEPWAFETKSYNATIARDDATDKATQIVEALTALDSRAGDAKATVITISVRPDGSTSFHSSIPPGQNWLDTLAAMNHGFLEFQRQFEESNKCPIKPSTAATPAPAVDAVRAGEVDALRVDWNRRELADAYDMVEGMRQQIAQPAESPLNQSLLTVMDALEAADVEWSGITKTDRSSEA